MSEVELGGFPQNVSAFVKKKGTSRRREKRGAVD